MIEMLETINYGRPFIKGTRPPGLSAAMEAKLVARRWAKFISPPAVFGVDPMPPAASEEKEPRDAPHKSGTTNPREVPGRAEPDAPSEPPAGEKPGANDLTCPTGCNGGKPFRSATALTAHRRAKGH
jgi:hypothetical protein